MRNSHSLNHGIALFILLFCSILQLTAQKNMSADKILYINSYSSDSYYLQEDVKDIVDYYNRLGGKYPQIIESMNCQSLGNSHEWQGIMEQILNKHKKVKAIVLIGNEAVISYLSLKDPHYKQIPLYILDCNQYLPLLPNATTQNEKTTKGEKITKNEKKSTNTPEPAYLDVKDILTEFDIKYAGLIKYPIRENLELIQRLYGLTKDIAILTDNSYTGLCMQNEAMRTMKDFPQWKFHFIDGRKLNIQQAINRVTTLPKQSILLIGDWATDKDNVSYLNNAVYAFKQEAPLLPAFSFSGKGIGYWAIGGSLIYS